jgi:hypothetical protein
VAGTVGFQTNDVYGLLASHSLRFILLYDMESRCTEHAFWVVLVYPVVVVEVLLSDLIVVVN